ncbi:MAG: mannose-1-phosphate guanylyltransferase [Bacteroidetes bacterium]|nr:mannose-1-phosphate guanylyltransferase [Bacteroidota bacterium]
MKNKTYVAIMAGGIGSRFWPASRTANPKQFLDILGVGKSLIRLTYERFLKLCPSENIFVVTHQMYKNLVLEHLPELSENQVICEPSRNNTGPCVAYTAFKLYDLSPEAVLVVAPSDHVILKEDVFIEKLQLAQEFALEKEALITLGITPTRPDTGYGYIHFEKTSPNGVHKVYEFKEKPDHETAQNYLESGDYLWNAGIFIWQVKTILAAFESYAPAIFEILQANPGIYNTENELKFIEENYPKTPNISIDFAILEKSDNVYTIPAEMGWSDLGTWVSLHEESQRDSHGNTVQTTTAMLSNVKNSLVRLPTGKLAVIDGLDNFIIVDEGNVLLIYPKLKEQTIKEVTSAVEKKWPGSFS